MHANIDFVTPQLTIGGDLDPDEHIARRQAADLVTAGITHIIDCRLEWTDEYLLAEIAPEIVYLHNGVDDHGGTLPDSFFERGTSFASAALEDPDYKVLAHCHMGINRGPSMGLAIMLEACRCRIFICPEFGGLSGRPLRRYVRLNAPVEDHPAPDHWSSPMARSHR